MSFIVANVEFKSAASERPLGAGGGGSQAAAAGCSAFGLAATGGVSDVEVGRGHAEEGEGGCEEGSRFDKHCCDWFSVRVLGRKVRKKELRS